MKVWNKRNKDTPKDAVYVGRPTKWGNPFSHLPNTLAINQVSTRDEAILAYEKWLVTQPELMRSLDELKGKDLVCWCSPCPCHAEVLMRYANK